jgi:hypothetical protein
MVVTKQVTNKLHAVVSRFLIRFGSLNQTTVSILLL